MVTEISILDEKNYFLEEGCGEQVFVRGFGDRVILNCLGGNILVFKVEELRGVLDRIERSGGSGKG